MIDETQNAAQTGLPVARQGVVLARQREKCRAQESNEKAMQFDN